MATIEARGLRKVFGATIALEDVDLSGASVDYFHYKDSGSYNYGTGTYTFNYSSPWHASTYLPETGAAVLK